MGGLCPLVVGQLLRYKCQIADTRKEDTSATAATDHGERLARPERACEHLAAKAGIERLQASTVKWIVGVGLAGAALAAAVASAFVTLVFS